MADKNIENEIKKRRTFAIIRSFVYSNGKDN